MARGIAHSNQIREFHLSDQGILLREAYLGDAGLVTGSARVAQEAKDEAAALFAQQDTERQQSMLQRKRKVLDAQIAALQLDLEADEKESQKLMSQERLKALRGQKDRVDMAQSRFIHKGSLDAGSTRPNARGNGR